MTAAPKPLTPERMTAQECEEKARDFVATATLAYEKGDEVRALLALYWQREAMRAEKRESRPQTYDDFGRPERGIVPGPTGSAT